MGRPFASSYLARDAAASLFFPRDFRDAAARVTLARQAAQRQLSPVLTAVLRAQQALLPPSPARQANLDALSEGRCAVVVTGQQVGLFLGPLYTFYKAASAIAVARAIEAEAQVRCVPLFWLQTEDHDFAEIASFRVAGADGLKTLALRPETEEAARVSIAHRTVGSEITDLIAALADHLGDAAGAGEAIAVLRAHYVPGRPLAQAFAGALAAIFADEGLLFLDPRDARLAALLAPLYQRSLVGATEIDGCLGERASALHAAGFEQQVPLRPGSSLLFFHEDGPEGPRHRLRREDAASWRTSTGQTMSQDDLLATLARTPLRFSTSALLRPLAQDTLLPTVAYVGGAAEVSYFAQLMPLYRLFDVAPPLIVPRARFTCVDARARRLLAALKLTPGELALPADELRRRLPVTRPAGAPDPEALKALLAELTPQVDALTQAIMAAEPHLTGAAAHTRGSVFHALGRLTRRYERVLLERDTVTARRLQRLQELLVPDGVPQERVQGWPALAAEVGPAALKRAVFEALEQAGTFVTETLELRP